MAVHKPPAYTCSCCIHVQRVGTHAKHALQLSRQSPASLLLSCLSLSRVLWFIVNDVPDQHALQAKPINPTTKHCHSVLTLTTCSNHPNTLPHQLLCVLQALVESAGAAHPGLATGAAVTGLVMTAGVRVLQKGLTPSGIVNAFALGTLLYGAFGAGGFSLLCLYFIFGTAVRLNGP